MPWVEELSDPRELRRCIHDLVALSTLPALWTDFGPQQIADSVAAALVSMLDAEFIYIAIAAGRDEPRIEVVHAGKGAGLGTASAIRAAIHREWLKGLGQTATISNPIREGTLRIDRKR